MTPHILVADDHVIIHNSIRLILEDMGYKQMTGVTTCHELMSELKQKPYTHLILDMILTDGISLEILPSIRKLYPHLQIMVFSMQPIIAYRKAIQQYGIVHFASKASCEDDVTRVFREFIFNMKPLQPKTREKDPNNPFTDMTSRELQVLHYVLRGFGTTEIGVALNLKRSTVSTVKARLYEKTNTTNVKELMRLASLHHIH